MFSQKKKKKKKKKKKVLAKCYIGRHIVSGAILKVRIAKYSHRTCAKINYR